MTQIRQIIRAPWRADPAGVIYDSEGRSVAIVAETGTFMDTYNRLIAAAPDLLEALQALVEDPRLSWLDLSQAEAAIARATARDPDA